MILLKSHAPLSHYLFAGCKVHKIMEDSKGKYKRHIAKLWNDANNALTVTQEQ